MARRTSLDLAKDVRAMGFEGKVVGVHSNLSQIGIVAPSRVSEHEKTRGMSPIAKTIINGFLEGLGPQGTLFVPTHSVNYIKNGKPIHFNAEQLTDEHGNVTKETIIDHGYYDPDKSPSTVGAFTQAVIWDDRARRSLHPTHSVACIGPESEYLVRGHIPGVQPVGINNAFAKNVGLDGIVCFVGDTLKSNTTFHAFETLLVTVIGEYMIAKTASLMAGHKQENEQTWNPGKHRDFYEEQRKGKPPTRAFTRMREAGLLHEGVLGKSKTYYFHAKETARFFMEEVIPESPDILLCEEGKDEYDSNYSCEYMRGHMKRRLTSDDGAWDAEKIRAQMDNEFLRLMQTGVQRIQYDRPGARGAYK
jgi:aminoglycoside N3'-acetyltransferase